MVFFSSSLEIEVYAFTSLFREDVMGSAVVYELVKKHLQLGNGIVISLANTEMTLNYIPSFFEQKVQIPGGYKNRNKF